MVDKNLCIECNKILSNYRAQRCRSCASKISGFKKGISSLEKKFLSIVNKYNLPYRFVGNGEVIIGRKVPDFVNCNGQKIAVEVFYKKHKEMFRDGLTNWMRERTKIFNNYGWKIEYFNELQVNEKEILRRIG